MSNTNMKAWRLHAFDLNRLQLDEVPVPVPGPGELLIRVGAVSLNYRDKAIIEGYYDPNILLQGPLTLVGDVAGTVVSAGNAVTRFNVGDRVTSHLFSQWLEGVTRPDESNYLLGGPLPGGLAEYMIIPDYAAVAAPAHLSDEEAATLPIAALTAWHALTRFGRPGKGSTVLIQGTGGVSIFAIQLASALGAEVIVTTSNDEKGKKALALGASHIINYVKTPDWDRVALEITSGKGVDQILEVVGGDKSINQSVRAIKVEGLINLIGFLDKEEATINILPVIFKQARLQGSAVGHRKAFEEMNAFLAEHQEVKPVIDRVYAFEDALTAFRHLDKGAFGKIVIKVSE
ncbi:NAD(P)-dependent alcohol dehydrogenase [Chitinophaga sp. 30R24]|uniref:zinc-dependent alcohol dehydrogenase family protein n=1 Tax=Chitinophaga sp. 30R24 TaxID=3248838 RepID=UPI003B906CA0